MQASPIDFESGSIHPKTQQPARIRETEQRFLLDNGVF